MRFLSVCSGIEAASVAWHPLGWHAAAVAEIEPFPSAVLSHHFPEVPNLGDFTRIVRSPTLQQDVGNVPLLVGGTPCQSFSVAGLRGGLSDERGNLALEFVRLAAVLRPRWVLWENVPGVLSSGGGRDFGSILGALVQLGYGFAYRVLDAQHFGVPQRRRRVFLVGHIGGRAERAAAVLFEPASVRGNPSKGGSKGQETSRASGEGARSRSWRSDGVTFAPQTCGTLSDGAHMGGGLNGQDAYTGRVLPVYRKHPDAEDAQGHQHHGGRAVLSAQGPSAYDIHGVPATSGATETSVHVPLRARPPGQSEASTTTVVSYRAGVRRLTPTECERLQGFPDGWTDVPYRGKPATDGPRYKAIGNSMAVPVMRWIGERIKMVDEGQPST